MELLYVSLLSIFVVLVSLLLHFLFFNKPSAAALPPGKYGWPAVGETLAFLSTGWNGHPEKFIFDRVIKYSSAIFRTHLFGERTTIFTGSGGNKFLFSNENKLLRVWWPASVDKFFPFAAEISSTRTEEAIKMRKMLSGFLKPESLQRYIGIMDEMAQRHFADGWENREEVAVLHLTENYTFLLACRLFVSMDDADDVKKFSEPFKKLVAGMISIPIDLPGTQFNKGIKAAKFIRRELAAIMKQRKIELTEGKASASQDVMSHMLVTRDENGKVMHELGVVDSILGLLVAGHDTVSSACAFVVNYLADLPHIYEGVYKEQMEIAKSKKVGELLNWDDIQKMKYSWNVVCEVLRLKPPLPGAFREALTDFMFNGFTIPKGWKIYYSANSTHLNPDYFPNPQKFDPSRYEGAGPEPYTFVPFGGGSRMCPGKEYARLEILVFVHNLVKRFRFEKLIPDEKIVVNPIPLPTKGLPVRLYPHIHKP